MIHEVVNLATSLSCAKVDDLKIWNLKYMVCRLDNRHVMKFPIQKTLMKKLTWSMIQPSNSEGYDESEPITLLKRAARFLHVGDYGTTTKMLEL